ncbi:hypothetical protein PQX77_002019 [Marasmius sp. AFHP31]|nr:hypothetical protein PQX77_002019 [Marasmius sp. AFHP31]
MPRGKTTKSHRPQNPRRAATKKQRETCLNEKIRAQLRFIRIFSCVADQPRPPHLADTKAAKMVYIGSNLGISSPAHPKFCELGKLFYVFCGIQHWPVQPDIPLWALKGDKELLRLLKQRAELMGYPLVPEQDDFDDDSHIEYRSTPLHGAAAATTVVEDGDDDIEIVEVNVAYKVKVWVYVDDTALIRSFTFLADASNGFKFTLNAMRDQLWSFGIPRTAILERSVDSEWKVQLWAGWRRGLA